MNNNDLFFVFTIPPILLILGFYLLFYKRNLPASVDPAAYVDQLNLPEFAKEVRRKEIQKKTATFLSFAWFREYWKGERTAFSAWISWLLILPMLLTPILGCITTLISRVNEHMQILFPGILAIYYIFACIIWWKCARNSSSKLKTLARTMCSLTICSILYSMLEMILFILI